jgi:hypothetical protein
MSTAIPYPHLTIDDDGTARIERTRYKVIHLAGEHYHYGWPAEEIFQLSLLARQRSATWSKRATGSSKPGRSGVR